MTTNGSRQEDPAGADFAGGPPGGRGEHFFGFRLWLAANAWQRSVNGALLPLGLTHVQYILLTAISRPDWDGRAITQAMLARRARIDEMMTSQVPRTLEAKALIVRQPHPSDLRAKDISLTPEGADLARRATAIVEEANRRFFAPLGEAAAFAESLGQIAPDE